MTRFSPPIRRAVGLCLSAAALCSTRVAAHGAQEGASPVGVVVLAHGGSEAWNRAVEDAVRDAGLLYPTHVGFGMGMHPPEAARLQALVDELEAQGVQRLIVVPLLVSSHSEVMRQFEYLFGRREDGPWDEAIQPLRLRASVAMTAPLDDDPLVANILLERARAMSRRPEQETVLFVAHGPTSGEDDAKALDVMQHLAARVKAQGRFRAAVPATMRDDAPPEVQAAATAALRELVTHHGADGDVLVVPLLLAAGGIEHKIPKRLEGLSYRYTGEPLLPHANISAWIAQQVREGLRAWGVASSAVASSCGG